MLIKLTGPREGQTVELCGVQFENGFAEVNELSVNLQRYHGVVEVNEVLESPLEDNSGENTNQEKSEEVSAQKQEDEKELKEIVESKKQELSKERIKTQKDFSSFGAFKAYVGKLTGTSPRGGKQAIELLAQYAQEYNIEFEVE